MFVSRGRGPASPHLEWRIRIFGVGAILAVAGMIAEMRWMVWIALAVLLVGVLLRLLPRGGSNDDDEKDDSESDQP
jgi:hypothetical protein